MSKMTNGDKGQKNDVMEFNLALQYLTRGWEWNFWSRIYSKFLHQAQDNQKN